MVVLPYSPRKPRRLPVVLADPEGRWWDDEGAEVPTGPPAAASFVPIRYAHADDARVWLAQGRGRGTYWNGTLIRWEPSPGVKVTILPNDHAPRSFADRLAGVVVWADWSHFYGVPNPSSIGGTAFKLLRAQITEPLFCTSPRAQAPPIRAVVGGRQEMGFTTPGSYKGPFELWDMSAAYARTVAAMPYGGWWRHLDREQVRRLGLDGLAGPAPAFVRAVVTIPPDVIGPLPERPRGRRTAVESALFPVPYPRGVTMQGVWTVPEVASAQAVGCDVRLLEGWLHFAEARPFAAWWKAIDDGRGMGGYAGTLAKATGNALVGQFHIDRGRKETRWVEGGESKRKGIAAHPRPPATDLAEWVCGSVRARLYSDVIAPLGERVLCAHTDGAWIRRDDADRQSGSGQVADEAGPRQPPNTAQVGRAPQVSDLVRLLHGGPSERWRHSDTAAVLDLLDPQHLAYRRPGEVVTRYKMAGSPLGTEEDDFAEAWPGRTGGARRLTGVVAAIRAGVEGE